MPELNYFIFNCLQSFLFGIIQGITEFLPISSTAHLKVVPFLLGWNDPGVSISASLQLGSAFAIIFYFRKELFELIQSSYSFLGHRKFFKDENTRLATYVFVASIPIIISGFLIKFLWSSIYDSHLRSLFTIGITSIVMSILLALSEIYGERRKLLKDIKLRDVMLIGISQAFSIIPGVSRSGITLTSALFSGIERQTAARFSFLIGIPAISISGFVELFTIFRTSSSIDILPVLIGIISSFFSSLVAVDFLLKFIANNNTFIFVYYRLAFGVFILSTL